MKHYISEGRAIYEDHNHGLFSKRLAEWAIKRMRGADSKPIAFRTLDDVKSVLEENKINLPEEFCYTAWYVFNMAIADYPKSLKTDTQRALFVDETICDPDGMPENVLSCFEAKMCNDGVPIYWEDFV